MRTYCSVPANQIVAIDSMVPPDNGIFSWNGAGPNNDLQPLSVSKYGYNSLGSSDFARNRANAKSSGRCAKYVREAMMSTNGGNLQIKRWPNSACVYVRHMPKWGFVPVYKNTSGHMWSSNDKYKPQDGDVSVIAGQTNEGSKRKHGHIQIYNSSTKKWYSDFGASTAWCYGGPAGRPYVIFRYSPNYLDNENKQNLGELPTDKVKELV